jgi:non-specific serine/threonine protein kinase
VHRATVVADTIPRQIGHYPVECELGRGGMGVVYLGRDPKLNRKVAVKVLPSEWTGGERLQRFEREARTAAQLSHPNIATIYELGRAGETYFIAMEYIDGKSLRDRLLASKRMSQADALELATQIADALVAAHDRNIVHRDLKPHNVMLTGEGRVKILDFGLAKRLAPEGEAGATVVTQLTAERRVLGTPGYMSPEQVRGEQVDARSDIFSFGVLLYETVTGEAPFTGESDAEVLSAILRDTPLPVRKRNPDVSQELDRFIGKCLEKAREKRFQSARELLSELRRVRETVGDGQAEERPSIAVLPFENMSADPDNEYFTDGMAEEILNALSTIEALRVASRTSSFAFKGKHEDIRKIGHQLDVQTLLEGSVRKAGNRLRISAKLINVADGYQLWSERYDRDVEDVFAIQDEIAANITQALRVVLTESEKRAIEKVPTQDVRAYDCYLRGRQFFHEHRRKSYEFARQMFHRATQIDPGYAHAYAGIADCCSSLYRFCEASDAYLQEADDACRKALALDPELAEAHVARGLATSLKGELEEARKEFEIAIQLNPQLFDAFHVYGRMCFGNGEMERARELFERTVELDPEEYTAAYFLALAYKALGREADARSAEKRGLELIKRHLELNPDDAIAICRGATTWAQLGETEMARDWAGRAISIDPDDPLVLYNVGCVQAALGEREEAIDCLERSVACGMGQREWPENDPDLDAVRDHPRFQALLEKMS